MVQDVTPDSPAERAGLQPYDVIVGIGDESISRDDELIRAISAQAPGTTSTLRVWRQGREESLTVKLAERPVRTSTESRARSEERRPRPPRDVGQRLGLTVRDLDASVFDRLDLPSGTRGVLVTGVEPLSASSDADVQLNTVILEINRQPVRSTDDYARITDAASPGGVLAIYVYAPELDQRQIKTVRIETR
jgi:serine protease Do